jgi:serine O-acetyltransferase
MPHLLRLIVEDMRAQREGLLAQGFWALLVYRFGHSRFRLPKRWMRLPLTIMYVVLNKLIEITTGISIGARAEIGRRPRIEHFGGIIIHGSAIIGDDCMIRHDVTIGNRYLARPLEAPVIGNRVDIGTGARILGNVRIGDGAHIGANAVVLHDVPVGATAVGIPARIMPSGTIQDSRKQK